MIFDAKARWRHFLDTIEAFFELEYLTANAAQKVMMMALVRNVRNVEAGQEFPPRRRARLSPAL